MAESGVENGSELFYKIVLTRFLTPLRPGRAEPRVRKRRPKQYPLMKLPRAELRKALLGLEVAA